MLKARVRQLPSSLVSPKLTRLSFYRAHCVPQEGGRVQELESVCWGVLGSPSLENTKVTKCPFHVFDRYEIPIQDFEDCCTGIFIISWCPSSQKLIKDEVPKICPKKQNYFPIFKCQKQTSKFQNFKKCGTWTFQFCKIIDSHIYISVFFQKRFQTFLDALKYFWYLNP